MSSGRTKQLDGSSKFCPAIMNYLEIGSYVESSATTNSNANELISFIKWMTYENGHEIPLPAEYRTIKLNLLKALHGRYNSNNCMYINKNCI